MRSNGKESSILAPIIIEVIVEKLHIRLIGKEIENEYRRFEFYKNNVFIGEINIFHYYTPPRISFSNNEIAIWGHLNLYLCSLKDDTIKLFAKKDEIHQVYPVDNIWCLVNELSVVLFDPKQKKHISEFFWHEVLLDSYWKDGLLHVKDFEERVLVFNIDKPDYEIICINLDSFKK